MVGQRYRCIEGPVLRMVTGRSWRGCNGGRVVQHLICVTVLKCKVNVVYSASCSRVSDQFSLMNASTRLDAWRKAAQMLVESLIVGAFDRHPVSMVV